METHPRELKTTVRVTEKPKQADSVVPSVCSSDGVEGRALRVLGLKHWHHTMVMTFRAAGWNLRIFFFRALEALMRHKIGRAHV